MFDPSMIFRNPRSLKFSHCSNEIGCELMFALNWFAKYTKIKVVIQCYTTQISFALTFDSNMPCQDVLCQILCQKSLVLSCLSRSISVNIAFHLNGSCSCRTSVQFLPRDNWLHQWRSQSWPQGLWKGLIWFSWSLLRICATVYFWRATLYQISTLGWHEIRDPPLDMNINGHRRCIWDDTRCKQCLR